MVVGTATRHGNTRISPCPPLCRNAALFFLRGDSPTEDRQPADKDDRWAEQTRVSNPVNTSWKTDPSPRPTAPKRPLQRGSEVQRAPDSMAPASSNCMGGGDASGFQESSAFGDGGGGDGDAVSPRASVEESRSSEVVPDLMSKQSDDVAERSCTEHMGVKSEAARPEDGERRRSAVDKVMVAETADVAAPPGATPQASSCGVVVEHVGTRNGEEHHGSDENVRDVRSEDATLPKLLRAEVGVPPAVVRETGCDDDDALEPAVETREASLFIGTKITDTTASTVISPSSANEPAVGTPLGEAAASLVPGEGRVAELIAGANVLEGTASSKPQDVAPGVSTLTGEAGRSQATAGLTRRNSPFLSSLGGVTGDGNSEGVGQASWTTSRNLEADKRWGDVSEGDRSASACSAPIGAAGDGAMSAPAVRTPSLKESEDVAWMNDREAAAARGDLTGIGSSGVSGGGTAVDANKVADPSRRPYDGQAARFMLHDRRPSPSATRSRPALAGTSANEAGVRSSLPWGWRRVEESQTTTAPRVPPEVANVAVSVRDRALPTGGGHRVGGSGGRNGGGDIGVGGQVVMVDRGEWEALKRENDSLRRQFALAEKRSVFWGGRIVSRVILRTLCPDLWLVCSSCC